MLRPAAHVSLACSVSTAGVIFSNTMRDEVSGVAAPGVTVVQTGLVQSSPVLVVECSFRKHLASASVPGVLLERVGFQLWSHAGVHGLD